MIEDFWLGVLAASTCALGITVAIAASILIWFARWLAKFADVHVTKDKAGGVNVNAEVRGK